MQQLTLGIQLQAEIVTQLHERQRHPTAPTSTRPVDPDVVPAHGDVIVSEGSGDEVLRGEYVVAHKPVSTNCPPPLRPGPASSCLVTAIDCTKLRGRVLMHASPR